MKAIVTAKCTWCGKDFDLPLGRYNDRMKTNGNIIFCSRSCSTVHHNKQPEVIAAISATRKGISVLSRGRLGHEVPNMVREKIRLAKVGKAAPVDTEIILSELKFRKIPKYFAMVGLIPDAVFIEDGRLVALEVEKERWESGIRLKMAAYNNRPEYEKVILVWYSPKGERLKEWIKENGEWRLSS